MKKYNLYIFKRETLLLHRKKEVQNSERQLQKQRMRSAWGVKRRAATYS